MIPSIRDHPTLWGEVAATGGTPDDVYRWGYEAGRDEATRTKRGDYVLVLVILAVGFTVGAIFAGFVR